MFPMKMDEKDFVDWVLERAPEIARIRISIENGNRLQLLHDKVPTRMIPNVEEFDEFVRSIKASSSSPG